MRVKLLFFARAREVAGTEGCDLELPGDATTDSLLQAVRERWPDLENVLAGALLAVNQEYHPRGTCEPLKDGDEVAIIPPISGG